MRTRLLALAVLVPALAAAPAPRACTTFCFLQDGAPVFGKNYDWNVADGLVIVNKRGVAKQALAQGDPLRWTSRYGSVTFNQYGREFPSGGINEQGLVVELMWLDDTAYPAPDARPALPNLQWIQYQLDCSATVADVIASDSRVRIESVAAKIHFLVADARGATAAIEFLDGAMVVHEGARALTNDTYQRSLGYARAHDAPRATAQSSLDRFALAARAAAQGPEAGRAPVDGAFDLLARVAQGEFTQWSIVYDVAAMRVHFRTRVNPVVRWIDLARLDFDCAAPALVMDISDAQVGDVTEKWRAYDRATNRALIGAAFAQTEFLRGVPADELDALARFPEQSRCAP